MIHLKGEIYLGLKKDPLLLEFQDFDNETILTNQKEYNVDDFINLYDYNIEVKKQTNKLTELINNVKNKFSKKEKTEIVEQFSLKKTYENKNSEDLIKYIESILNKLFPKYPKDHKVPYDIFGYRYNDDTPYRFTTGFRPISNKYKTFDFHVKYEGINKYNQDMFIKISWDFKYQDDLPHGHIMYSKEFAEEILYALSETQFLSSGFTFYKNESYSQITEYGETKKLKLIDYHIAVDVDKLDRDLNDLVELTEDHGDLIPLSETDDLLNYDGHGYLCKEIDGKMYQSFISPNMDYRLPKIYTDNFTHIYWCNR